MDSQHTPTLDPDRLEQELRAAMNGEPSAQFVAGIRARVAVESMARPWWTSHQQLALGAAVLAACTVLWTFWPVRSHPRGDSGVNPQSARARSPQPVEPETPAGVSTPQMATPPTPTPPMTPDAPRVRRPETAAATSRRRREDGVPSGREWLDAVDRGLITLVMVEGETTPVWPTSPPSPLVIPSLAIEPVAVEPLAPFAE